MKKIILSITALAVVAGIFAYFYLASPGRGKSTKWTFATKANVTTLKKYVDEREKKAEVKATAQVAGGATPNPESVKSTEADISAGEDEMRANWRVSAVSKFVPLTERQREVLRDRFLAEVKIKRDSLTAEERARALEQLPTLAELIGEDQAKIYHQQIGAAFARAEQNSLERELAWLEKVLKLNADQESKLRAVYEGIEQEIREQRSKDNYDPATRSPHEQIQRTVAENVRRQELLMERARSILSAAQMKQFAREQADSTASDMEVFHSR